MRIHFKVKKERERYTFQNQTFHTVSCRFVVDLNDWLSFLKKRTWSLEVRELWTERERATVRPWVCEGKSVRVMAAVTSWVSVIDQDPDSETVRLRSWVREIESESERSRPWDSERRSLAGERRLWAEREMACMRMRGRSGVRREKERERLNVYVWLVKNKRAKRHSFGIKWTGPKPVEPCRFAVFTVEPAVPGFWSIFPDFRFFKRTGPD